MKVYLAGPDVFRPDVAAWAATARECCRSRGLTPLLPLDGVADGAAAIFHANCELLRQADAVVANLNPFRGHEPDSGTCVEVGMALALGKPVFAYLADTRPLAARIPHRLDAQGLWDQQGQLLENFGLPLNLMLAVPVSWVSGDLATALDALLARFNARPAA
ncbi:MAG: hypothetical protein RIR00_1187 [Pseudomonadota bacterium]|jgi:nucleoside 2-deoxyribosyltransferase